MFHNYLLLNFLGITLLKSYTVSFLPGTVKTPLMSITPSPWSANLLICLLLSSLPDSERRSYGVAVMEFHWALENCHLVYQHALVFGNFQPREKARRQCLIWGQENRKSCGTLSKGHPKVLASKTRRRLFLPSGALGSQGLLRATRKMNPRGKVLCKRSWWGMTQGNSQERAEVENYPGSALRHIPQTLSSPQICPEQSRRGHFQTAKSKLFRKEKND